MRAAFLEQVGQLVIKDVPQPTIESDDQILVQIKTVGVCGSEIHAFEGSHPFRKPPVVLGHETAGEVISVGPAVKAFKPGDRVIVDPQWSCGICAFCQAGDVNLCPDKKVLGTQPWQGAFGEYLVAPKLVVFGLPDNLSYLQGSLVEPLTIAVHNARRAQLQLGQSVAVLGTGSIGGMVTGVCHAMGAGPIITADIHQHCLDAARERLGATHDILLPDDGLVDKVMAATRGKGVDVVFVTADDPALVNRAIEMAARRATIVLVALLTEVPLQFFGYDLNPERAAHDGQQQQQSR